MDELRGILAGMLHGKHTHVDPLKALVGLTPTLAREKPNDESRSCWELLFHMAYWQDIVLKVYDGEDISGAGDEPSWPKPEEMANDDEWNPVVERFKEGLARLVKAANDDDLKKPAKVWGDAPLYSSIMVEIAHNSFHLGQIVAIRKMIGNWPPPEEDK